MLHLSVYIKHPPGVVEYNTADIQYLQFEVVQGLTM
jgi:hypothetical protein